jgi:hypothetical protein
MISQTIFKSHSYVKQAIGYQLTARNWWAKAHLTKNWWIENPSKLDSRLRGNDRRKPGGHSPPYKSKNYKSKNQMVRHDATYKPEIGGFRNPPYKSNQKLQIKSKAIKHRRSAVSQDEQR